MSKLFNKQNFNAAKEFKSGGRTKLRGGGMSQRGLGRAFMKGGKV